MKKRLVDEYSFPGFRARSEILQHPFYPDARIIILDRLQKKVFALFAGIFNSLFMTGNSAMSGIYLVENHEYFCELKSGAFCAVSAAK